MIFRFSGRCSPAKPACRVPRGIVVARLRMSDDCPRRRRKTSPGGGASFFLGEQCDDVPSANASASRANSQSFAGRNAKGVPLRASRGASPGTRHNSRTTGNRNVKPHAPHNPRRLPLRTKRQPHRMTQDRRKALNPTYHPPELSAPECGGRGGANPVLTVLADMSNVRNDVADRTRRFPAIRIFSGSPPKGIDGHKKGVCTRIEMGPHAWA